MRKQVVIEIKVLKMIIDYRELLEIAAFLILSPNLKGKNLAGMFIVWYNDV